ncbi:carbon-nitrogen hydrolase family protein [Aliikangiella sp. IMCC44359]|uniref:carbon-nitrogen hydrolase family protein n=1 Tax=Aliikangiella sp. IMCC44359 TaxID=3459125 RepID=UPI00403AC4FB
MSHLKVALAQIAPVWLNREATLKKIEQYVIEAAKNSSDLIAFGESLVPGYPFWLDQTDGAKFNCDKQKKIHSEYSKQAVQIERGDLNQLCKTAKSNRIAIYLGIIERPKDRSGHSLYCSLVYIDQQGVIQSVHRKLMPTYEERLSWSPGDGHGLVTHPLKSFTVGGLNCWENWMPLARASLYAQGEDLHIAVWPGNERNTVDLTPVMAKEGRSYVISVCGLMRPQDAISELPELESLATNNIDFYANGGSCLAAPDGSWVIPPQKGTEGIYYAEIDHAKVREERQNFDPAGHYSRPDVTKLEVNRQRQTTTVFKD